MKYVRVPSTHVQGVLFKDDKRREIILAFREFNALQDFQYDGMWSLIPFNSLACKGCQIHQGHGQQWNSAAQQVNAGLQQAKAQYPRHSLVIAGHSLGAGLASQLGLLCAMRELTQQYTHMVKHALEIKPMLITSTEILAEGFASHTRTTASHMRCLRPRDIDITLPTIG